MKKRIMLAAMLGIMGFFAGFLFWLLSLRWLTHVTVLGWIFIGAYCALFFLPAVRLANRWRGGAAGFAASLAVVRAVTEAADPAAAVKAFQALWA